LTARSKIREVIRGLVATRQVHSISLGHAPHFYVAGTLPEFEPVSTMYASAGMPASSFFTHSFDRDDEAPKPAISVYSQPALHQTHAQPPAPAPIAPQPSAPVVRPAAPVAPEHHAPRTPARHTSNGSRELRSTSKNGHDRKPSRPNRPASSSNGHATHRSSDNRKARPQNGSHSTTNGRWTQKNGNGKHAAGSTGNGSRNGSASRSSKTNRAPATNGSHRNAKSSTPAWSKRVGTAKSKPAASRKGPARKSRPTLTTAGRAGASGKRFFNNRSKNRTGQGTKKHR
jgi:hypothetical protein